MGGAGEGGVDGRDNLATTFEHVTSASISRNGRKMVTDLKARMMRIDRGRRIEIFSSESDDPVRYLTAKIDFNAVSRNASKEPDFSFLTADSISFNPDRKRAEVRGGIKITKDKLTVTSESIDLDLDNNIAFFTSTARFKEKETTLTSSTAEAFFDDEIVNMFGSVEVLQKNKVATSAFASYHDKENQIVLSPAVTVIIDKLKNSMKQETAEKYKSDEAKQALEAKTVVTCDELTISTKTGDASARGSVHVTQGTKEAKADAAVYSESDQNIVLTGNVTMKRGDVWIKANEVIVSVDKESFEAIGQVETEFTVKRGNRKY